MCPNVFVSFLEKGRHLTPDLSRMDKEKYIVRNQAINWLSKWVSAMYLRLIFHCVLTLFLFTEGLEENHEVFMLDNSSWDVPIWVTLMLPHWTMRSICSRRVRFCGPKIWIWKKQSALFPRLPKSGKSKLFYWKLQSPILPLLFHSLILGKCHLKVAYTCFTINNDTMPDKNNSVQMLLTFWFRYPSLIKNEPIP